MIEPRIFKALPGFVVSLPAIFICIASARATAEKDEAWRKLIAEAQKHGGVETVLDQTASYVFAGPDGLSVTFTRTLDDKRRFVCAAYMSANIDVCMNWDTEKMVYGTRADASAPWVASDIPPDVPESAPEAPRWLELLSAFFDADVPYLSFHAWRRDGGRGFLRSALSHGFGSRLFRRLH